jgi:hypothetical protein
MSPSSGVLPHTQLLLLLLLRSTRSKAGGAAAQSVALLVVVQVQIRRTPKPVVAMVAGYAVGGGHILHMVCDLTVRPTPPCSPPRSPAHCSSLSSIAAAAPSTHWWVAHLRGSTWSQSGRLGLQHSQLTFLGALRSRLLPMLGGRSGLCP